MNSPIPCSGSTLGLLFRQVRDAMWTRMERELEAAGHELTFSQYVVLKRLADGPATATDLARYAELNPGAMTRLLDKLEEKSLVAREPDPADRRVWHIRLTQGGQTMWQDVNHCGQRVRERALTGLSADERAQLLSLLERVRDNLGTDSP